MSVAEARTLVLHRPLSELHLNAPVRVSERAPLGEVARFLRDAGVSSALVGSSPREIVTERDLTRALAAGLNADTPVERVSQPIATWVTTTSHVVDAAELMIRDEIRHLIVLDAEGEAVGVVSMRDIFSLLLDALAPGAASAISPAAEEVAVNRAASREGQ